MSQLGKRLFVLVWVLVTGCETHQSSLPPVEWVGVKEDKPVVFRFGEATGPIKISSDTLGGVVLERENAVQTSDQGFQSITKPKVEPINDKAWNPVVIKPVRQAQPEFNVTTSTLGERKQQLARGELVEKKQADKASLLAGSTKAPHYLVKPGDTLYSISRTFDQSVNHLVKINKLREPYHLQVGQEILLDQFAIEGSNKQRNTNKSAGVASYSGQIKTKEPKSIQKSNKNDQVDKKLVYQKNGFLNQKKETISNQGFRGWVWPVHGQLIQPFTPKTRGVDISGSYGAPISAAADGSVVYAGSDLVGYGNLIILEHEGGYLSAYAHNSRILVKEGKFVKAGQKIAELGSSGTDKNKLHFEIRKNGKPVDPLVYLPLKSA